MRPFSTVWMYHKVQLTLVQYFGFQSYGVRFIEKTALFSKLNWKKRTWRRSHHEKHNPPKSATKIWICYDIIQSARNIPGIFAECSLSVAMFRASRKHLGNILKENIFKKILNGKVVFFVKRVLFDDNICWSFGKFQ